MDFLEMLIGFSQQEDKLLFDALARERHGFPRGEAGRRSLTDEDRRNLYCPMQFVKTHHARTFFVLFECIQK